MYKWQPRGQPINAYSDSGWAGDRKTRRSISGGVITHGPHVIKAWARPQTVVALSSAEVELYIACRAAQARHRSSELCSGSADRNRTAGPLGLIVCTILGTQTKGVGEAKYIDIQNLCLQDAHKGKRAAFAKIHTDHNPAYLMTNAFGEAKMCHLMQVMHHVYL